MVVNWDDIRTWLERQRRGEKVKAWQWRKIKEAAKAHPETFAEIVEDMAVPEGGV